jgi:hypothetical protein
MGIKLPLDRPTRADGGSVMTGLEYHGDKIVKYRGYRQDIEPILKAVELTREQNQSAALRDRLYKPSMKIPVGLIYAFAKEVRKAAVSGDARS